jgi:hypothetical protein
MAVLTAATTAANTVTVASIKYLEIGQQVDVMSSDGLTARGSDRQITAINETSRVVTISGAAFTASVGDILVRQGSANREINGLAALVTNTGTLQNLDPAVVPQWSATVDSNAGTLRTLSEGAMILQTDRVRTKGGKTSLILCGLGVRRAYWQLLVQQRRFTDTKEFTGGIQGLAFNNGREIPVVEDPDAPDNTMYFLDESSFKIYRPKDWSWINRDGSTWKWVHDFDAYEAIYHIYQEFATTQRNANAVMTDLIEG